MKKPLKKAQELGLNAQTGPAKRMTSNHKYI
jgi:hypothetical protein